MSKTNPAPVRSAPTPMSEFAKKLNARESRTIEFKAKSGRAFVLRELDGAEQTVVDSAEEFDKVKTMYRRVVASIVSIEGHAVPALVTPKDFRELARLLTGGELDDLLDKYTTAFIPDDKTLKKDSPATSESQGSPTPGSPE